MIPNLHRGEIQKADCRTDSLTLPAPQTPKFACVASPSTSPDPLAWLPNQTANAASRFRKPTPFSGSYLEPISDIDEIEDD
jgi:hypothetical protein